MDLKQEVKGVFLISDAAVMVSRSDCAFTISDAASVAVMCVCAAGTDVLEACPIVVARAKAMVAVLLYPAGAITVNGASATNDIEPSPQSTDAITASSGA